MIKTNNTIELKILNYIKDNHENKDIDFCDIIKNIDIKDISKVIDATKSLFSKGTILKKYIWGHGAAFEPNLDIWMKMTNENYIHLPKRLYNMYLDLKDKHINIKYHKIREYFVITDDIKNLDISIEKEEEEE